MYPYPIHITCMQLYGFEYSYLIIIVRVRLQSLIYSNQIHIFSHSYIVLRIRSNTNNLNTIQVSLLYSIRIHMQTTQYKYTSGTLLFRHKWFINFWLRFFDTRRGTQLLLCWPYYLTPPNALRIFWCLRSRYLCIYVTAKRPNFPERFRSYNGKIRNIQERNLSKQMIK